MNDLVKKYTHKRAQTIEENKKLMKEARKISSYKVSLLIVKHPTKDVLNVALKEKYRVTEINFKTNNVNMSDKIHFHKQTNEVLYHNLLCSTLSQNKLENKMSRLEKRIKKEKAMNKSWYTQVKSFEEDLIVIGVNPQEQQHVKRLLEEKDKTIQSLNKKLNIPITVHPQTEEMIMLQKERDDFYYEG